MGSIAKNWLPLVAATLGVGSTILAAEPTTADVGQLQAQIQELKQRVDELQAKQVSSAAVDSTVNDVLSDADRRSQLLAVDGTILGGWDKGKFTLRSADGNYSLTPSFQFQFRSTTNYDTADDSHLQNGFEIRRLKIGFEGNAISPDLTYYFLWATASGGSNAGNLNLEQAWAKYKFADQWSVRVGQIVDPVVHEQLTSSKRGLAGDRSLLNQIITGAGESFTQAATLIYDSGKHFRTEFGFTDGINTANRDWQDPPANPYDFGVAGRAEYFVFGKAKQYEDFSALGNTEDLLVIGAGGDISQNGDVTGYLHTADIQYENAHGLNFYAAYLANWIDTGSSGGGDLYNWGFLGQVGYLIQPKVEIFGRYDYTKLDAAIAAGTGGNTEDAFNEITAGVNYFIKGHNAQVTVDLTWLPDGAPNSGVTGLGFVGSADDEFVLRAQFQLLL